MSSHFAEGFDDFRITSTIAWGISQGPQPFDQHNKRVACQYLAGNL
jgi:hypothetical protein